MENDGNSNDVSINRVFSGFCSPWYKAVSVTGRTFKKPSSVVPQQAYTVRELLERSIAGTMPAVAQEVYYADDKLSIDDLFNESGVDVSQLDLVELQALRDEVSSLVESRLNGLKKAKNGAPPVSKKEDGADPSPTEE